MATLLQLMAEATPDLRSVALDALLQAADMVVNRQRGGAQQLRSAMALCHSLNPKQAARALRRRAAE
ncbi:MAG: hypothetical protein DI597_05405 [Pseudoxanthomonas spadix]|nr:MAG: hypothetical protein DI597_05405 [Pseudoxanthomonas spadix]